MGLFAKLTLTIIVIMMITLVNNFHYGNQIGYYNLHQTNGGDRQINGPARTIKQVEDNWKNNQLGQGQATSQAEEFGAGYLLSVEEEEYIESINSNIGIEFQDGYLLSVEEEQLLEASQTEFPPGYLLFEQEENLIERQNTVEFPEGYFIDDEEEKDENQDYEIKFHNDCYDKDRQQERQRNQKPEDQENYEFPRRYFEEAEYFGKGETVRQFPQNYFEEVEYFGKPVTVRTGPIVQFPNDYFEGDTDEDGLPQGYYVCDQ